MAFKAGILFLCLLVGSYALPALNENYDILFDHTDPTSRIVGGIEAGIVPHMVALTSGVILRSLFCGGSLISNRHVLSAAHCVRSVTVGTTISSNVAGIVGSNRWNSGGTQYRFSQSHIHQDYSPSPILKNDIAIMVTSTNVVFNNNVAPININYDWAGAGVSTIVHGWGATRTGGGASASLFLLNAEIVDGDLCKDLVAQRLAELNFKNVPVVDPAVEICTFRAINMGTCNGDSGSALLRSDHMEQVGLVSWGVPCARNAPDMFVRISAFRDWINNILNA